MKSPCLLISILVATFIPVNSIAQAGCDTVYPSMARAKVSVSVVVLRRQFEGLQYGYNLTSDPSSERAVSDLTIKNVIATTISSPNTWRYIGIGPGIYWKSKKIMSKLKPGSSLDGFVVISNGIPVIVDYRVTTHLDYSEIPKVENLPEDCEEDDTFIKSSDVEFNSIKGKTIGPRTPPSELGTVCDTFILDLIGQVREAASLGWIKHDLRKDDDKGGKNKGDEKGVKKGDDDGDDHADDDVEMDNKDKNLPGVAKSIIKKLTKVRRECMRGKFSNAREKLRAFLRQVNAQRGKHLTEEAYALIKFNVEFLLEKL